MDLQAATRQFYEKGTRLVYYEGLTPIHVAAGTGHLKLLETLMKKTDEKHPKDSKGKTPLLYASQNGH